MKIEFLSDIKLGTGVNIEASEIELRGDSIGGSIIRDPINTPTVNFPRAKVYSDGTVDSARFDEDGFRWLDIKGYSVALIIRDDDGFESSRRVWELSEAPLTYNGSNIRSNRLYTNNNTITIPPTSVNNRVISDGEFIKACLENGFTETRQTTSTHHLYYEMISHPLEKRSQINGITVSLTEI